MKQTFWVWVKFLSRLYKWVNLVFYLGWKEKDNSEKTNGNIYKRDRELMRKQVMTKLNILKEWWQSMSCAPLMQLLGNLRFLGLASQINTEVRLNTQVKTIILMKKCKKLRKLWSFMKSALKKRILTRNNTKF